MKGRDIAVWGKGLKVGISPALQQMAMCGSDGENGHPGRASGPSFVLELGQGALDRGQPLLQMLARRAERVEGVEEGPHGEYDGRAEKDGREEAPHVPAVGGDDGFDATGKGGGTHALAFARDLGSGPSQKGKPHDCCGAPQSFLDPLAETRASGRHR